MPWPSVGSGTSRTTEVAVASRNPSYVKKKNARSFLIGPPSEPPKMFLNNCGRSTPAALLKKSFAVVTVLRWVSNNDPCQSFDPERVTSETCAPEERPCSAFGFVVVTRNSCNESRVTLSTLANASSVTTSRPSCCSLTSTPSSVMFDWSARPPFTKPERLTPGCSDSRPTTLLAFNGSSTMRLRSNEFPSVASLVLIAASADAVTSTVSETAPISSCTSRTVGVSTSAIRPDAEAVLKPVALTSSLYVPGGTAVNTYAPSWLVC